MSERPLPERPKDQECTSAPRTVAAEQTSQSRAAEDTPSHGPASRSGVALPIVPGYDVIAEIGRGGMGVIYKARQTTVRRVVALKMVLAGAQAGPDERGRFLAEARAAARLSHPGIVQLYDAGEFQHHLFLTLEFIDGGTLAQRLGGKPVPPRQAAHLVELLASAVHYAHERGVVHRDLKPSNILLAGGQFAPKITDFGLAKIRAEEEDDNRTRTGLVMGTPSYMAPEQARGEAKDAGPPADIWALGAILYECLTGRPPFKGATMLATINQVLNDEPLSPRKLQARVGRDLETVVLKCLEKDPQRRYGSAEALAEDLRAFQEGRPVKARPISRPERLRRWVRRHPVPAGLLLASVLAVFAGLLWRQTRPATLDLHITPPSASATLDGNPIPLDEGATVLDGAPGLHRLRVQAEDYLADEREVRLVRGQANTAVVRINLTPLHGRLSGTSQPEGAAVEVVDAKGSVVVRTATPLSLRLLPGAYTLRMYKDLYEPAEVQTTVQSGQETTLATVRLKSAPGGADSEALFALMDKLASTRWAKVEALPAGRSLPVFLEDFARRSGVIVNVNEAALKKADLQADKLLFRAQPALNDVSPHDVLTRVLGSAKLTFIPRMAERGQVVLEVLTPEAAERTYYQLLHSVRDLVPPRGSMGSMLLITMIRQTVGQQKDWALRFDPITGQPINPLDEVEESDEPRRNNQIGFVPGVDALAVGAPWRIQQGVRDCLRKLRVAHAAEPAK